MPLWFQTEDIFSLFEEINKQKTGQGDYGMM